MLWIAGMESAGGATLSQDVPVDLEVFTREGCPRCAAAKIFLAALAREQPSLTIQVRDLATDHAARVRLKALAEAARASMVGVPAFYLHGQLIIGFQDADTTGARIRALLSRPVAEAADKTLEGACRIEESASCEQVPLSEKEFMDLPLLGRLSVQDLGLPLFTVVVGLLDGFNPCSMWVLVFMLSLLATLKDRLKMFILAGTFVLVEGVAYFIFMTAWLNIFLLLSLSRMTEVILGTVGIMAGAIHVKDFWAFGRGLSLKIPEAAKPTIYAQLRHILQAECLWAAVVGTIILGVLVQVVELLCTAGFPALYTKILTMRELDPWTYYGYVGLYNVAYMADDVLILTVGVITLSQRRLQEREGRWLKLASGLVMLGLGLALVIKPRWLMG
jgi:hypothetical protein